MKKILIIFLFLTCLLAPVFAWGKKQKPVLLLSPYDPRISNYDTKLEQANVFKKGEKIYFMIYNPKGFESQYIKYQIIRQDDNAFEGGYKRERNVTIRVNDKNKYVDYFVLNRVGKYYIQIFDITNLQQWLAINAFMVVDE